MKKYRLKIRQLTLLGVALTMLSGCYINLNKHLDREVRVRVNNNLPVSIDNQGNSTFNEYLNDSQYVEQFMAGLKAEFSGNKIVIDDVNPEFEVRFSEFSITESTKMETVNNESSPDHGKEFELSTLNLVAKGTVVRMSDGVSYDWYASKNKNESLTSLRSADQIAKGTNKEKNQYREKSFVSGTATDLTQKVGRRSGTSIVKEIYNSIN